MKKWMLRSSVITRTVVMDAWLVGYANTMTVVRLLFYFARDVQ